MATETVFLDGSTWSVVNLTATGTPGGSNAWDYIDDTSGDSDYLAATSSIGTTTLGTASFSDPSGTLQNNQVFKARLRVTQNPSKDISYTIADSGGTVASGTVTVTSTSFAEYTIATVAATSFNDSTGASVTLQLTGGNSGGPPSTRWAWDVSGVWWEVEYGTTPKQLDITGADLAVSGGSLSLKAARKLTITGASLAVTGGSLAMARGRQLVVSGASLAITGGSLSLKVARKINISGATVAITGGSLALKRGAKLAVTGADIALTGGSLSLKPGKKLDVSGASVPVVGGSLSMRVSRLLQVSSQAITLTGGTTSLRAARKLNITGASLTLTGGTIEMTQGGGAVAYQLDVTGVNVPIVGGEILMRVTRQVKKINDIPIADVVYLG